MSHRIQIYVASVLYVLMASSQAFAQAKPADCAALYRLDCRKDLTFDPKVVKECIMRGYDAPKTCRKDEGKSSGVRVGGSNGFSYGAIQAPESAPGLTGAAATVSADVIALSLGWGLPCITIPGIHLCGPPATTSSCAVRDDTTGAFGVKQNLVAGNKALACGGAVPLTTYETTLNKDADRVASTEDNSFYIWFYKKNGNSFSNQVATNPTNQTANPFKLPKYLCDSSNIKTVDLTPPIAQIITYESTSQSITLRLRSREFLPITNPDPIPEYNEADPEKFLIIPIVNGVPSIPADCALDTTYYKAISPSKADIVLTALPKDSCEENHQHCASLPAGQCGIPSQCDSLPPDNDPESCPVVQMPSACPGKSQYIALDRPNLLYPASSTASLASMQGRTALLAATLEGSKLFMPAGNTILLGNTAPPMTLLEGGTVKLTDGSSIRMSGPATIDPSSGQLTMTSGGQRLSSGGSQMQTFPSGTNYTPPNLVLPLAVSITRSMNMPEGFLVPTQPAPYVQLPK